MMDLCAKYHDSTEGGHLIQQRAGGGRVPTELGEGPSAQNRENAGYWPGSSLR